MSESWVNAVLDVLRRDGSVVVAASDLDDVDKWRRIVRQACRAAGLRVRTGVNPHGAVWVYHLDHVVTDAAMQAAARAMDDAFRGAERRPFQELVREEQRKRLTVVQEGSDMAADERSTPGDVDSLVIDFGSRQYASTVDDERFLRPWYGSVELVDDDDESEKIGYIVAHTVDYEEMANPFIVLDDESADLGHIAGVIFDPASGKMRSKVTDLIESAGYGMLIIDSVWLEPSWRGHGLGPLLVGMVIEHLGAARQFVALQPAPIEHHDSAGAVAEEIPAGGRRVVVEKLGALWAQLGFELVDDDVWILNLGSTTFAQQMSLVRSNLGLT
jgi:GNAT superfamily N-acetyltransferase